MKKWDQKSIELLLEHFNDKKTYNQIGVLLSRTNASIRCKLNKLGYKYRDLNPLFLEYTWKNCGKLFIDIPSAQRRFCSQSCAATSNNKTHPKRTHIDKHKNCIECDNQLINKWKNKYCSKKCEIQHKQNLIFQKIENGDITLYYKNYKNYLIHKYGNKCMKCGWHEVNPVTGVVPIQIEHKDGNSENHNLSNLELLCPNCHSLTPTYGALNKGNGRTKRREKRKMSKYNYGNLPIPSYLDNNMDIVSMSRLTINNSEDSSQSGQ